MYAAGGHWNLGRQRFPSFYCRKTESEKTTFAEHVFFAVTVESKRNEYLLEDGVEGGLCCSFV
jgi:hypothetical protein